MGSQQDERISAMAKPKRPSLADIMQQDQEAASTAAQAPRPTGKVVAWVPPAAETTPANARTPEVKPVKATTSKPHTTLYLDPAVRHAIKRIALDYNKKPHDLLLEGVDMMLTQYTGKGLKDIATS
jgi:hypothetical protein